MTINVALYSKGSSGSTIGASEYSLTNDSTSIATKTDTGFVTLLLDCANMAAGDEFEIAKQEKAVSGGTQRRTILSNLVGAQTPIIFETPPFFVGVGWDITVKKIAGTDRAFTWTIRSVT